ncbi:hypothetical protein PR048_027205 [Dryococelus australis]|uniref:Uncharacterized protein n=1 Tax=Dryococelus australis TaxID=614101 RepID=A0ABQ9GET1_9NEOP|nr:hypothetical protein PR048_027205 [Dryococelus australis]
MSRQSQCSRVLQAPSCTVGFTRRFHTLSSIQATNTSLVVVLQSPVVHTSLHTRALARWPPSKTVPTAGPRQYIHLLGRHPESSPTCELGRGSPGPGERRSVTPASLAAVGIYGIPRREAIGRERIVPGRGEGEMGHLPWRGAANPAPAAAHGTNIEGRRKPDAKVQKYEPYTTADTTLQHSLSPGQRTLHNTDQVTSPTHQWRRTAHELLVVYGEGVSACVWCGRYTKTVVAASLSAQKYNPELAWTQRSPDMRIAQLSDKLRHIRQRLECSPPIEANQVQSPAGPLPDFRKWESCQMMPLVGGFSRESPVSPAVVFRVTPLNRVTCNVVQGSSSCESYEDYDSKLWYLHSAIAGTCTAEEIIFEVTIYSILRDMEDFGCGECQGSWMGCDAVLRCGRQVVLMQLTQSPESDSLLAEEGSGSGSFPVSHVDDEDQNFDWPEQGSGSGDGTTVYTTSYLKDLRSEMYPGGGSVETTDCLSLKRVADMIYSQVKVARYDVLPRKIEPPPHLIYQTEAKVVVFARRHNSGRVSDVGCLFDSPVGPWKPPSCGIIADAVCCGKNMFALLTSCDILSVSLSDMFNCSPPEAFDESIMRKGCGYPSSQCADGEPGPEAAQRREDAVTSRRQWLQRFAAPLGCPAPCDICGKCSTVRRVDDALTFVLRLESGVSTAVCHEMPPHARYLDPTSIHYAACTEDLGTGLAPVVSVSRRLMPVKEGILFSFNRRKNQRRQQLQHLDTFLEPRHQDTVPWKLSCRVKVIPTSPLTLWCRGGDLLRVGDHHDTMYAPSGIDLPPRVLNSHCPLVVLRGLHSGAGKSTSTGQYRAVPATITPQLTPSLPGKVKHEAAFSQLEDLW